MNKSNLESNECELILDVVDKIALRFATVLIEARGSYVPSTQSCSSEDIMSDAYDAANDFLKEKTKRDEFQITVDEAEEAGVDVEAACECRKTSFNDDGKSYPICEDDGCASEDGELVAVVKQMGVSGQVLHLVINDIPVASVGSYCPNLKYRQSQLRDGWSIDGLKQAARDINDGVELDEQETEDRPPIAFVQTDDIGNYLVVSGTTVCRVGEVCRDSRFRGTGLLHWTTAALKLVAEGINKEL